MAKMKGKQVKFQLDAEPGSQVGIAGSFNDWDPQRNPMMDNPKSGCFQATLWLPPGRHEYKFVVNGDWIVDPNSPELLPNGMGSMNSVVMV